MAKKDQITKLSISIVGEESENGKAKTLSRTIANVNPALSDADAYTVADKYSKLQSREVGAIKRIDTAVLTQD